MVMADVEREARFVDAAVRAACRTANIAAAQWTPPVSGQNELLGVIEIHFSAPHTPSARELRISDLLARQAADYLERRQIESEVKASEERFRAFTNATSDVIYRMNSDWTQTHHLHGREFIADTAEPTSNWLAEYIPVEERPRVVERVRTGASGASGRRQRGLDALARDSDSGRERPYHRMVRHGQRRDAAPSGQEGAVGERGALPHAVRIDRRTTASSAC